MRPQTSLQLAPCPAEAGPRAQTPKSPHTDQVERYYAETLDDYRAWSQKLNMHFGFWRRGLRPWRLESMLEELTRQVLARLDGRQPQARRALDMGCGAGAPALLIAGDRPDLRVDAISIVESQLEVARAAAWQQGLAGRARFHRMDYTATQFEASTFDAAYAIESACHASGAAKRDFVAEAARLLKPGGTLVVADGFIKKPPRTGWVRWCIDRVCRHWAVEQFAGLQPFVTALRQQGFVDIRVEEVSWNVAPSMLHIPFVTARFLGQELLRCGLRLGGVRWGHVFASLLAPIIGAARRTFGYYIVSANKGVPGATDALGIGTPE